MSEHWFRLPDLIVHPTPLAEELAVAPWHVSKSRVVDARAKYEIDGSGVTVAICDTGFDKAHIDLGNLPNAVQDFTNDGPYDGHGHGTHVAGCVLSMAPKAKVRSYKCLDDRGAGDDRWIARAIIAAADEGCWIINGSFGSPMPGNASLDAIQYAATRGSLVIIAGGNTGRKRDVQWPARSDLCTGISPTDENDRIASFGSLGPEIDAGYYGVKIRSFGRNGGQTVMSGSSMAAPNFAGLLALRLQWEVRAFGERKTKTVADVNAWLASCCKDAGDPGKDEDFGYGIPDAMEAFKGGPPPVFPPSPEQPEEFDIGGIADSVLGAMGLPKLGVPIKAHRPPRATDRFSVTW